MTIIAARSGYHRLKLDRKLSLLTTFTFHFARNRFTSLPFRVAPARVMFQRKIDEFLKDLSDVFGIADDIFIVGHDGKNHNRILMWVMQICNCKKLKT